MQQTENSFASLTWRPEWWRCQKEWRGRRRSATGWASSLALRRESCYYWTCTKKYTATQQHQSVTLLADSMKLLNAVEVFASWLITPDPTAGISGNILMQWLVKHFKHISKKCISLSLFRVVNNADILGECCLTSLSREGHHIFEGCNHRQHSSTE